MKGWKRIGKIILFFLFSVTVWQTKDCHVQAAGANISIKTDNATIKKGDIFYIVITVDSSEEMSGFEGYFSYNQSVMKYITGGTVSSGNDDEFSISDTNRKEASTEFKYSIQFKARREGSSSIALKSPYGVYRAEDSTKMPVASNVLNILVVKEPMAASTPEGTVSEGIIEENQASPEPSVSELPQDGEAVFQTEIPMDDEIIIEESFGETAPEETAANREVARQDDGLSATLTIFLLIFSIVLLIAIVIGLIMMKNQSYEEEEQWNSEEVWEQEEDVPEEKADDLKEPAESLEEIEKRLDKKRYWLKK